MAQGVVRFIAQIGERNSESGRLPVVFAPDKAAYLNAESDAFESQLYVLQRLHALNWPAYVHTAAADIAGAQPITALAIPKESRVIGIEPDASPGWFHVRLDSSAARHAVNTATADGKRVEGILRQALERDSFVFVVDDVDTHEILDASAEGDRLKRFSRSIRADSIPVRPPGLLERLRDVPESRLQDMFAVACRDTCTLPPKEGCSPFVFPDDGCWARAERMCENLEKGGFPAMAGKVWIYGNLVARNRNHPGCSVRWDWHVAPVVSVGNSRYRVFDPAIDDRGPLPYDEWRSRISGVRDVRFTEAWVYKMAQPDELRAETKDRESDDTIEIFRLRLLERIARLKRNPPYCS
jgi:hypothetical protein